MSRPEAMPVPELLDEWPWLLAGVAALAALLTLAVGPARLLAHALYRFDVYGRAFVPASGPALLVANRLTLLDWALVLAASPRRVRVPVGPAFARNRLLRLIAWPLRRRLVTGSTPRELLKAIRAALDAGDVVLVFPEPALSRNGSMLPFDRAFDLVLSQAKGVPVVPAYLDNLWGCQLSYSGGRLLWKRPEGPFRRHVAVSFGPPLLGVRRGAEVRAALQEAAAECGIAQSRHLRPAPRQLIRQAATFRHLFRRAFVDGSGGSERVLNWAKVIAGTWGVRDWLAPRVGPAQNVAVWLPTGMGSSFANAALGWLGKATVNLNYTAGPDLVRSALRQADVTTVVTARRFVDRVPLTVPPGVQVLALEDALAGMSKLGNALRFAAVVLLPGFLLERWLVKRGRTRLDDVATILFSSGSTGEPKGVVLTHRNVAANVESFRRGVEFHDTDRMLVTLPFFHSFGHTVSMWATMVVGMEAVFFADPRQAKEVGELCRRHACTILLGTATFLRIYLRRAGVDDFKSLRLIVCGAEKLPVKLAEEFQARFGVLPLEGYGCTELSPVVSVNLPDVCVAGQVQRANTPGTVGQPIPHVCARAFDADTLAPLPAGEIGILGVKGPNVMAGYLHEPAKTAAVIRDGWYNTGDVGRVEDDGFIRITGRLSRFAKIAGEMIPLERLDDELHDALGKAGERVLAVAAVPCDKRGERVVVLHLAAVAGDLEAAFAKLRERGLPNLWIPDRRDCYAVPDFPLLGTGKLDLRGLAERANAVALVPHVA